MPPKGKKKGPQAKGTQQIKAKPEQQIKEDKLNLQEVSNQIEQDLKKDMQAQLVVILGELDYNDMIVYVYTTSVIDNEERSAVLEGVQDLFPSKNQAIEFVDWLFDKMKAKYGGIKKIEQQVEHVQRIEKQEEPAQKKIIIAKEEGGEQEEAQKKGNVFDRITKKKDNALRKEKMENIEADLIKEQGVGGRKRIKKEEGESFQQEKQEEVKVNSGTIIDLNSHKNNIRTQQPGQENQEDGQPVVEEKKKVKCRHWPNCNLGDEECPFVHPKEECPYFPKCQFGEKCLMIHPDIQCKFGLNCNRPNCSYKHPKGKMNMGMMGMPGQMQKALMMMMTSSMMTQRKPKNKTWVQKSDQEKGENKEENENLDQKPMQ